jgi:hypothetical protein
MAIGKVSGVMLQNNLARQGSNLAFDGNLIYLDVTNRRIGVNTVNPTKDFQVVGVAQIGNIVINGDSIAHVNANSQILLGNINQVHINGGSANNLLYTDGAGNLAFTSLQTLITLNNVTTNNIPYRPVPVVANIGQNSVTYSTNALTTGQSTSQAISILDSVLGNITNTSGNVITTGNLRLTGGFPDYILSTDGAGNTFWANLASLITSEQFTGVSIPVGVNTIGSLSNAISIPSTTSLTDSVALLNQLLGNITNSAGSTIHVAGNVTSSGVVANNFYGNTVGTVLTSVQPYITSLGNLDNLVVNNSITSATVTAQTYYGNLVGNTTGTMTGNVVGNITGTNGSFSGNLTTSNVYTINGSFTGNIYGNVGTLVQPYITSVGNLTSLSVIGPATMSSASATTFYGNASGTTATYTGNVSVGNLTIGGTTTLATLIVTQVEVDQGNLTAANTFSTFYGNAFGTTATYTSNLTAGSITTGNITSNTMRGNVIGRVTGNVTGNIVGNTGVFSTSILAGEGTFTGNIYGNTGTPVQPYITTVGTLGNLAVAGNITANNVTSNLYGNVTGTVLTPSQPYITTVGNLGNLVVNTSIVSTTVLAQTYYGNIVGNVTGTVLTPSQPYITTVGNLGNLVVNTTIVAGGNITTVSNVNAVTFFGNIYADRINSLYTTITEFNSVGALGLPNGNTTQRPPVSKGGYLRYNTDVPSIEYYDGAAWVAITNSVRSQIITPDGVNQQFQLNQITTSAGCIVSINGTVQQPGIAYNVNEDQIIFTETPLPTDIVDVRFLGATVNINTSLADNLNIAGNLAVNGTTSATTVSTGAFSITERNNQVVVSCNGIKVFAIDRTGNVRIAGNVTYGPIA